MDLEGLWKAEIAAIFFKIQYYYTDRQTGVIFIQFGILIRIKALRVKLYKHYIITTLGYGFTLIVYREQVTLELRQYFMCKPSTIP